jgi:hypothetical protein
MKIRRTQCKEVLTNLKKNVLHMEVLKSLVNDKVESIEVQKSLKKNALRFETAWRIIR